MKSNTTSGTEGIERRRHLLDLDDFPLSELQLVLETTDAMREVFARDIKKVPTLRGKTIITLFYEPSTRTRVSFEQAAKILSADVINVAASTSSAAKGESLINVALSIQAMGADLLIVRHPQSGAPYLMARCLDRLRIINAGDGCHAHPTQALLDLYTIRQHVGRLDGIKVVVVGDILHSRVVRSNLFGLIQSGANVVLSGPQTLLPVDMLGSLHNRRGLTGNSIRGVEVEPNLDRAIDGADVVMALRLQRERQDGRLLPSVQEYCRLWQINDARLKRAKPGALVLHPGPINEGIEISSSVAHGVQSAIEAQVANGVAVRMALLYLLVVHDQ